MQSERLILLVFLIWPLVHFGQDMERKEVANEIYKSRVWNQQEDNNFAYFVYGLTVTKKGTILAFSEARIEDGTDDGAHHIVLKRSDDKGIKFSHSTVVVESKNGQSWANPTVLQDRVTGSIFLFYALNHKNISTEVFYIRSEDDGITWSKAFDITQVVGVNRNDWTFHLPGPGHGIQLKNKRLIIPIWHRKAISFAAADRNYGVNCLWSDDHGKTWKIGGDTPVGQLNESQIVEQKNGNLLLIGRTIKGQSNSFQAKVWSKDKGITWTQDLEYDTTLRGKACDIGLIRLNSNVLIASQPADLKKRKDLTIRMSNDEGKTWAFSKLLQRDEATYSDLAVLPDETIICLYGHGGTGHMPKMVSLARFSKQWLLKKSR